MKTIDCATLGVLIDNDEPVDLIDVRPKGEFAAMHIPGARSIPLRELSQRHLFRKISSRAERVYVISDDRGSASLAAGILRASNDVDAVVIDGGMKAWIGQGLPLRRARSASKVLTYLRTGAAVLALACIGFALRHSFLAAVVLFAGAVLLLKARMLERALMNQETRQPLPQHLDLAWAK